MKYKEGDIVRLADGRLVYLMHDEGHPLPQWAEEGAPPMRGYYSALYYLPAMGIDCADWGLFRTQDHTVTAVLTDDQVPPELLAKIQRQRQETAQSRLHHPIPA
jgi:hypothetical protein